MFYPLYVTLVFSFLHLIEYFDGLLIESAQKKKQFWRSRARNPECKKTDLTNFVQSFLKSHPLRVPLVSCLTNDLTDNIKKINTNVFIKLSLQRDTVTDTKK